MVGTLGMAWIAGTLGMAGTPDMAERRGMAFVISTEKNSLISSWSQSSVSLMEELALVMIITLHSATLGVDQWLTTC